MSPAGSMRCSAHRHRSRQGTGRFCWEMNATVKNELSLPVRGVLPCGAAPRARGLGSSKETSQALE